MRKPGYVYILTNEPRGELFISVTSNLAVRAYQHKHNIAGSFTDKPYLKQLVYYEKCESLAHAITRKKSLSHELKSRLSTRIENINPDWHDLYPDLERTLGPNEFVE